MPTIHVIILVFTPLAVLAGFAWGILIARLALDRQDQGGDWMVFHEPTR